MSQRRVGSQPTTEQMPDMHFSAGPATRRFVLRGKFWVAVGPLNAHYSGSQEHLIGHVMQLDYHLCRDVFVATQSKDGNLLGDMKKLMNYLLYGHQ